jgi:hypothetical protein
MPVMALALPRGAKDRGDHPCMTAAPAKILRERVAHVGFGGMGPAREKRGRRHDHAVGAIAALRRLLGDEGRLHAARSVRIAETLERRNLLLAGVDSERHTGSLRLAVDEDAAGAALAKSATEFGAAKPEIVAQGV